MLNRRTLFKSALGTAAALLPLNVATGQRNKQAKFTLELLDGNRVELETIEHIIDIPVDEILNASHLPDDELFSISNLATPKLNYQLHEWSGKYSNMLTKWEKRLERGEMQTRLPRAHTEMAVEGWEEFAKFHREQSIGQRQSLKDYDSHFKRAIVMGVLMENGVSRL